MSNLWQFIFAGAIIVAAAGLGTLLRWLIFERKS